MAQTATNPDTGETVQWDAAAGQWVPMQPSRPASMQQVQENIGGRSFGEQFLLGMGRGMSNVGRQIGNITGLVSDEELEAYRQLDQPLLETGGGMVGNIAGEIAATAPLAGGIVGAGAKGVGAALPALRTAMAGTRAGQVGTGAGLGLAEGAIEGALLSGPEQRASGAVTGAALGAAGGSILPLLVRGFRTPSESARTIMAMEPSPDLTPGMMKPGGMLNQFEQAAGSIGVAGPLIRGARETPQRQFAQAMINQGRPPGTNAIVGTDVNDMLDEVYTSFEPAYGQLKGFALKPEITAELANDFARASQSQSVSATDDTRKAVNRYLANQATRLRGRSDSDDLLEIRSNIRDQSRKAAKSQNWEKAELFDEAEKSVTERLNAVLPEGFADLNKAIDSQYAKHKIAETAVYRMGNRDFPTPTQWQQAVRESTDRGTFARGGGLLRPETKAASDVFRMTEPTTGARLATLMSAGAGLGGAAGIATGGIDPVSAAALGIPLSLLAATKGGRRAAVGETNLQKLMQRVSANRNFMKGSIPQLPGITLRSIAPVAASQEEY